MTLRNMWRVNVRGRGWRQVAEAAGWLLMQVERPLKLRLDEAKQVFNRLLHDWKQRCALARD